MSGFECRARWGPWAFSLGAVCAASLMPVASPVRAAEQVCVVCTSPDAQYSCSLAPREAGQGDLGLAGARLKMRCIREIAESYGHQTCKVSDSPIATCPGTVHMVQGDAAPAAGPAANPAPRGGPRADRNDGPPKTVVDMTKRAAGETQEQLEKSGEVVERAARQTWRCVTSLFTKCDAKSEQRAKPAPSADQ